MRYPCTWPQTDEVLLQTTWWKKWTHPMRTRCSCRRRQTMPFVCKPSNLSSWASSTSWWSSTWRAGTCTTASYASRFRTNRVYLQRRSQGAEGIGGVEARRRAQGRAAHRAARCAARRVPARGWNAQDLMRDAWQEIVRAIVSRCRQAVSGHEPCLKYQHRRALVATGMRLLLCLSSFAHRVHGASRGRVLGDRVTFDS